MHCTIGTENFLSIFREKSYRRFFFSCVREESYLNTYPVRFFDKKKSEYKIKKKKKFFVSKWNKWGKTLKIIFKQMFNFNKYTLLYVNGNCDKSNKIYFLIYRAQYTSSRYIQVFELKHSPLKFERVFSWNDFCGKVCLTKGRKTRRKTKLWDKTSIKRQKTLR